LHGWEKTRLSQGADFIKIAKQGGVSEVTSKKGLGRGRNVAREMKGSPVSEERRLRNTLGRVGHRLSVGYWHEVGEKEKANTQKIYF